MVRRESGRRGRWESGSMVRRESGRRWRRESGRRGVVGGGGGRVGVW